MKAALYLRVSTDEQTTDNQQQRLTEVANARGWQIETVYKDKGISGSKGRKDRPAFDRMLKDAVRGKFQIVMIWSIDRMGRSLKDLIESLDHLHSCNVNLFCDQQAIDTTTPAGRAMFQLLGVFAEFERSMIVARVRAGQERARQQGKQIGREFKLKKDERQRLAQQYADGHSIAHLCKHYSIARQTAYNILNEFNIARH